MRRRDKSESVLQQTGNIIVCMPRYVYTEKNHTCSIRGVIVTGVAVTEKTA